MAVRQCLHEIQTQLDDAAANQMVSEGLYLQLSNSTKRASDAICDDDMEVKADFFADIVADVPSFATLFPEDFDCLHKIVFEKVAERGEERPDDWWNEVLGAYVDHFFQEWDDDDDPIGRMETFVEILEAFSPRVHLLLSHQLGERCPLCHLSKGAAPKDARSFAYDVVANAPALAMNVCAKKHAISKRCIRWCAMDCASDELLQNGAFLDAVALKRKREPEPESEGAHATL